MTHPPPPTRHPSLYIVDLVKNPSLKPPIEVNYVALRANLEQFWQDANHPGPTWLLAGGLTWEKVDSAVAAMRPHGVDVSRGVCGPDGRWAGTCRGDVRLRFAVVVVGSWYFLLWAKPVCAIELHKHVSTMVITGASFTLKLTYENYKVKHA